MIKNYFLIFFIFFISSGIYAQTQEIDVNGNMHIGFYNKTNNDNGIESVQFQGRYAIRAYVGLRINCKINEVKTTKNYHYKGRTFTANEIPEINNIQISQIDGVLKVINNSIPQQNQSKRMSIYIGGYLDNDNIYASGNEIVIMDKIPEYFASNTTTVEFYPDKVYYDAMEVNAAIERLLQKERDAEAKIKQQQKYDEVVNEAHSLYNDEKYDEALSLYKSASKIKVDNNEAADYISKTENAMATKKETEKKAIEERETAQKKALDHQETNSVETNTSNSISENNSDTTSEEQETTSEESGFLSTEALDAKREYQRKQDEEERKRKEEERKRARQAEYDLWKSEQTLRQREYEAAAIGQTVDMLMFLGGFIYQGMGNVSPENVFKNHEKSVKFYAGFDLGFSFTNMPLIFSSSYTTMINGEYENTKEQQPLSAYTFNLGGAVKLGLEHNNFNFNAFFAPQAGISPIFDGSNLSILNAGAQASIGANWVKIFGEYRVGGHDYSRSSNNVEESGSGKMVGNYKRITYGLKFTLNPKSFVRDHLYIGLMKEKVKIDDNSVMFDPDLSSFLSNTESKDQVGYTIQWKKDHNFNFYINLFPKYWYMGESSTNSGSYSSDFIKGKTNTYIEIGFIRSWDFFL